MILTSALRSAKTVETVHTLGICEIWMRPHEEYMNRLEDERTSVKTLHRMCRGLERVPININPIYSYEFLCEIVCMAFESITLRME